MEKSSWYSRLLTNHPFVVFTVVFVFSSICVILPLTIRKLPDFSDPQIGFEARGTPIASRLVTWKNLVEASGPGGILIDNPFEYYHYLQETDRQKKKKKHPKKKHKTKKDSPRTRNLESQNPGKNANNLVRKEKHYVDDVGVTELDITQKITEKGHRKEKFEFFCNLPTSDYARVVISSDDNQQNLWTLEGMLALCHIDKKLRENFYFSSLCQRRIDSNQHCCRSWSPANYIAFMSKRSSCMRLKQEDLDEVKEILERCFHFYKNHDLTVDCEENLRCRHKIPERCYSNNAVYHMLHYLLDVDFLSKESPIESLNSSMIILPIAASSATREYYYNISASNLTYDKFSVIGIEFGLKNTIFDEMLVSDSLLLLLGFVFSVICIWFYTGSLVITVTTILIIIFSLGISYAIYTLVLSIDLFPFMNLLAVVVAVGIGADDAFIFCKIWECKKREKARNVNINISFESLVHETIKHAAPSMFVTTLTTAVAFFASIVSNVTAINCFSLFSGITVIVNFILMVTLLPASVIIVDRYTTNAIFSENVVVRYVKIPLVKFFNRVIYLFTKNIVRLVILLKWYWFLFFLSLGITSSYIVFQYPGLQLPNTPNFQLFHKSHKFEQYDLIYTKHFGFERVEQGESRDIVLPLRFVWGVLPVDNGNSFDPYSLGELEFDPSFDISDKESQVWLSNFCKNLRAQSFYKSTFGPLLANCFIESLQTWMGRDCDDPVDLEINYFPCCNLSTFPYEPGVLKFCTAQAIAEIYRTPSYLWNFNTSPGSKSAGVKFRKENKTTSEDELQNKNNTSVVTNLSEIQIVVVEYDSNVSFSFSYTEMNQFYNSVETWMQEQLKKAPVGMKNGWFISHLEFYELQRTLYEGTIWTIVLSMGLSLTVLALITLNPFVSLYSIIAVGGTIIVTVAALIFLDWKLNVLESVAVSTAIGLAVDFNLHYAVSYRTSKSQHRIERVKFSLEQMAGPTLMAALTTGAAGALMLPSQVLPYIQIGMFLVIIMGVSWIYATFFLCPLLAIAGGPFSHCTYWNYSIFRRSSIRQNVTAAESIELGTFRSDDQQRRQSVEVCSDITVSSPLRGQEDEPNTSRTSTPSRESLNIEENEIVNPQSGQKLD